MIYDIVGPGNFALETNFLEMGYFTGDMNT
jgi:hypothetical protein